MCFLSLHISLIYIYFTFIFEYYYKILGAKYKARALHFAILNSTAKSSDWIVHLDEETRFNADTLLHCLNHCVLQDDEVAKCTKEYGDIGQGVIIYGTSSNIENYINTLADSIRVGDDFGKFRLQYQSHYPWIGMHGSFVVCSNAVEILVGFDNGLYGSITEDAYFALVAWEKGVRFRWVDAYMYEQSPFTIMDFIMQRRRWFGGLWLVVNEEKIQFKYRVCLLLMISSWALSALPVILTASNAFISTTDDRTEVGVGMNVNKGTVSVKNSTSKIIFINVCIILLTYSFCILVA